MKLRRGGIAERRDRRGVREPDQPVVIDHPDRLGDALQDRGYERFAPSPLLLAVSVRHLLACPAQLAVLRSGTHSLLRGRLYGDLRLPASFASSLTEVLA